MKLYFSGLMFFFWMATAFSREIVVIQYHPKAREVFQLTQKVILQRLEIPPVLITTEQESKSCNPKNDAIIQICIDAKGELSFPIYRQQTVIKTFKWIIDEK